MADNVPITPGSGEIIAADQVTDPTLGTVKVQYVKIMSGAIDSIDKAVVGEGGLKVDAGGVMLDVSATTSFPLPTGAATEATLVTCASEATLLSANGKLVDIEGEIISLNTTDFALEATQAQIKTNTDRLNVDLSTRLSGQDFNDKVGEVQATPTANTVLARLKNIFDQLTVQVRGLFDSLGNAISSALNLGERRILVSAIEERHRRSNNGQMFGAGLFAQNVAAGAANNWLLHIHNPPGSGKIILIDKWWFISFTNYVRFAYVLNPTVTADGTIITPTNLKAGGPASSALVYSLPTVTAATGLRFKEAKAGPSSDSIEVHDDFCIELAEGDRLVISGLPDGNNRLASISTQWAEVDA